MKGTCNRFIHTGRGLPEGDTYTDRHHQRTALATPPRHTQTTISGKIETFQGVKNFVYSIQNPNFCQEKCQIINYGSAREGVELMQGVVVVVAAGFGYVVAVKCARYAQDLTGPDDARVADLVAIGPI